MFSQKKIRKLRFKIPKIGKNPIFEKFLSKLFGDPHYGPRTP